MRSEEREPMAPEPPPPMMEESPIPDIDVPAYLRSVRAGGEPSAELVAELSKGGRQVGDAYVE